MIDRALVYRPLVPLLALAAIVALVIHPFVQGGLPVTSDGSLHLLRTVELDHLLGQGDVYPRWAADLWLGLGYPLFNFYGPLFYYVGELFHLLGAGLVGGVKLAVVAGIALGVGSTYLLARQFMGRPGAIVAALSFGLMPHALRELYRGGDYPQLFALALLPLTLWTLHLMRPGSVARLAPTVAACSALLLAHNLSVMFFGPVIAAYALFLALGSRDRRVFLWMMLAALLAFGLTAFFWLPALGEKDSTQVENLLTGYFDFRGHFLQPRELISPSAEIDLASMNPPVVHTIGPANVALALLALVGFWPRLLPARLARARLALFLLIALAAVGMMLPIAQPLWEALPLLALAQFPSRLLGVVGLAVALLAGSGVEALSTRTPRLGLLYGLIAVLALVYTSAPPLYPTQPFDWMKDPAPSEITRYELRTGALGTSSAGEFLPRWAELRPDSSPLTEAHLAGRPVERLDRGPLPPGTSATTELHTPSRERVRFDSPGGFGALFNVFYFPGWNAYVDGVPAVSKPFAPHAMTIVDVPPGQHVVELRFEDTPIRTAGNLISLGALLVTLAAAALGVRESQGAKRGKGEKAKNDGVPAPFPLFPFSPRPTPAPAWLFAGLLLAVLVVKLGIIDPRTDWFRKNSRLPQVVGVGHALQWEFANGMRLLGYDLNTTRFESGGEIDLVLYWQAIGPLTRNYSVFAHLTPPDDERQIAQADSAHPGPNPTSRWPTDAYSIDRHPMRVPPQAPPGRYVVRIGVYDAGANTRIPLAVGDGRGSIPLVEVEVTR